MRYDLDGMTLLVGDVREQLRNLDPDSVHCVVTSPPYWALRKYDADPVAWDDGTIGHYGLESTPELYVEHTVEIFREVRRVLRPDGTLWLNLGDCYASHPSGRNRPPRAEQGNGVGAFSMNAGAAQAAHFANGEQHRSRPDGVKEKDLVGIPWMVAFALRADGWYLRRDIIWAKPNPMPESADDRPTTAHEYLFLLAKRGHYFYDLEAVKEPASENTHSRGKGVGPKNAGVEEGTGRRANQSFAAVNEVLPDRRLRSVWSIATAQFPHAHFATFPPDLVEPCIKLGTSEHGVCSACGAPYERIIEKGEPELAANTWAATGARQYEMEEGRPVEYALGEQGSTLKHVRANRTLGWEQTCRCTGTHLPGGVVLDHALPPAVVPATVLDPFAGSGTTLAVARRLGREAIGVELSERYAADAVEHRLTRWWRDPPRPRPADEDDPQLALEGISR